MEVSVGGGSSCQVCLSLSEAEAPSRKVRGRRANCISYGVGKNMNTKTGSRAMWSLGDSPLALPLSFYEPIGKSDNFPISQRDTQRPRGAQNPNEGSLDSVPYPSQPCSGQEPTLPLSRG